MRRDDSGVWEPDEVPGVSRAKHRPTLTEVAQAAYSPLSVAPIVPTPKGRKLSYAALVAENARLRVENDQRTADLQQCRARESTHGDELNTVANVALTGEKALKLSRELDEVVRKLRTFLGAGRYE